MLEQVERTLADVGGVRANGLRAESREPGAVSSCAPKRLVDVAVHVRDRGSVADVAECPELLEVRDVRQAPHEGRRERRDLRCELVVRDRLEDLVSAGSRALHELPDLDSGGHRQADYRRSGPKG